MSVLSIICKFLKRGQLLIFHTRFAQRSYGIKVYVVTYQVLLGAVNQISSLSKTAEIIFTL